MINQMEPFGSRYGQKRDGMVCAKPNHHILAYISGWGGRFELLIIALSPPSLIIAISPHLLFIALSTT